MASPVPRKAEMSKKYTGAYFNQGFHGDSCITIAVGEVTPEAAKLIRVAEEALV